MTIEETLQACRLWKANGTEAVRLWWRERHRNHLHVLSRNPPVVYLWWGRDDTVLHEETRDLPLLVLYLFPWCATPEDIQAAAAGARKQLARFPRHRIAFLCNEAHAVEPLRKAGVEAVFCNQNAFVSEAVFHPLRDTPAEFDAVYNASLAPYKRHLLAAKIESLMLLTYRYAGTHTAEYGAEVRRALAHAAWLKDSIIDSEKVTTGRMVEFYNRARVGLILSEREGACFASMEYLLCGLPVVSTPSIGGRDVFWDDRFVIVCEPAPEAVAEAVRELKRRNIDPQLVRDATLEKVKTHRETLRRFLPPEAAGFECPWTPGSHGPFTFFNLRTLGRILRAGKPADLP